MGGGLNPATIHASEWVYVTRIMDVEHSNVPLRVT